MSTPGDRTPGEPREGVTPDDPREGVMPGARHEGVTPDGPHEGVMPDGPHEGVMPDGPHEGVTPDGPHEGVTPDGPRQGVTPATPPTTATSPQGGSQLRADCVIDIDGRITFRLPPSPGADPRLLLRLRPKKGQAETTLRLLDLEPDGSDGHRLAVLETHPLLDEGRWDVYLLPEPGAERRRLRPGLRDLRSLVDGHLRDRPAPVAVRIPYATKDGFLALRAWRRAAHAEARAIDVTDRAMTVTARLHGAELHADATVRLRLRGTDTVRTLRPRTDDDARGFSFTVGPGELADGGGAIRVWDAFVRPTADAPPVRVGRLLDDVADRKHVYVYPAIETDGSALRPYYTVDNDLAIEVT
ncbi:transferase [Streptomyces paradoxus]|uniref:transferase n=1 Tax=Streptomyces paradoxus TaxID=66375 RepID=UPI0037CEB730